MSGPAMRAAVLAAPGKVEIVDVPLPQPGPREVRVRLEGSGLCASSLPLWQGREWFSYPRSPGEPGHEGWGRIDALGSEVKDFAPGDRVSLLSQHAYAEYDVAPARSLVPLAVDGCRFSGPFPGEAFGCAMNVFERSGITAGQDVAVVGVGFLGALLIRLAVQNGAYVVALSRRPWARNLAKELGADLCLDLEDPEAAIERVTEWTGGSLCHTVIEATGLQGPLDLAAKLAGVRGRLVIAGYHQDGPRQVDLQLWNWRGLDVINAHERDPARYVHGIRQAVAAAARGEIDPNAVLTHRFDVEKLDEAFASLEERPDGFLKAWIQLW